MIAMRPRRAALDLTLGLLLTFLRSPDEPAMDRVPRGMPANACLRRGETPISSRHRQVMVSESCQTLFVSGDEIIDSPRPRLEPVARRAPQ